MPYCASSRQFVDSLYPTLTPTNITAAFSTASAIAST
jgi:hypothetical protein